MRNFLLSVLLAPVLALAQTSFPTSFPDEAVPLTSEALKQRLTGKTFLIKPVVGADLRIEYQDAYAFINVGGTSDSGKWRIEGSSVCVDWRKFPPSCSEARLVADTIYIKRANNGEVVALMPK